MDYIADNILPTGKCKVITSGSINKKIFAIIEDKTGNQYKVNEYELTEYVPDHSFKLQSTCWLDSDEYASSYQYVNGLYKIIENNDLKRLYRIFKRLNKSEQKELLIKPNFYQYKSIEDNEIKSYSFETFIDNKKLYNLLPKNQAYEYLKNKLETFKKKSKIFFKKATEFKMINESEDDGMEY